MRTLVPHPVVVTPCPASDYVDLVAYLVLPPGNQLIAIVVIGIVAGSMATRVVRSRGFGLLGNIVVGGVGLPALFFRNRALSLPITVLDRGRIGFSGGTTGMEGEDLLMATAVYLQQPAEDNR